MAVITEIEIKLPVDDLDGMHARLSGAGARLERPRSFEDNLVLDFPDRRLHDRGVMLRVRRTGGAGILTLKEDPRGGAAATGDGSIDRRGYKVRRESEIEIADADTLQEILGTLGLEMVYRYQKYRTLYRAGELIVTLDELPIGNYLELEGARAAIDRFAARLEFGRDAYIGLTYRGLQREKMLAAGNAAEPLEMLFEDGARA